MTPIALLLIRPHAHALTPPTLTPLQGRAGQGVTLPNVFRTGTEPELPVQRHTSRPAASPPLARLAPLMGLEHKQLHALGSSLVVMFPSSRSWWCRERQRKVALRGHGRGREACCQGGPTAWDPREHKNRKTLLSSSTDRRQYLVLTLDNITI